jgi:hypothetical protein
LAATVKKKILDVDEDDHPRYIAAVNSRQKRESDTVYRKRRSIVPGGVAKVSLNRRR